MPDCIFCKIVRKEIPAAIIYEDDAVIVFLDIKPVNPGHLLVVPKAHADTLLTASDASLSEVALCAKRMAQAVMKALDAPGANIVINNGRAGGQLIDHLHVHVIPRFENDGHAPWHGQPYAAEEMEIVAGKITATLE